MNYGHEWTERYGAPAPYCAHCRVFRSAATSAECENHPARPMPVFTDPEILPGDVIETPTGMHRELERYVVHVATRLRNGAQTLRARPLSNPRAIDWHVYVAPAEPELCILARGVAAVDSSTRGLLPA